MAVHPELAAEQAYLDRAYACLAAMRARTQQAASIADSAAQAVDSAIAQWHLQRRLDTLDTDVPGLTFGRLDDEHHDTWYVGRRHVENEHGDAVVVDWRAEIATPFYRATAADPLGLTRRRRFLLSGHRIDDLHDEVFDDPDSVHAAHGGIPDPLLAELERERTGEMRDIVATIAAEQDVIIRAPLDACLVVQGGPGTGKTAVGLHRAAFLLYEHRGSLGETRLRGENAMNGVLVVGPNPLFLRYISQVLPSLGEVATRQATVEGLVAGTAYRVRGVDTDNAARLKGNARMADVLARAVRAVVRRPADDLDVRTHWGTLRLRADDIVAAIDEIAGRGVPHNVGRTALRTRLQRQAWAELARLRGEDAADPAAFDDDLRANREWQRALARWWPSVSAPALVRRLLSSRAALRASADGLLAEDDQRHLLRPATRRIDDEPWTVADLVLVDEAEALVSGPPRAYGHIVVDEAQDVSAMGLRALARRCPSRSLTVLGDLAQATSPQAQSSWDEVVASLGAPPNAALEELDLGYRVPAPIMDFANRLLAEAAPDLKPTGSVRVAGRPPLVLPMDSLAEVVEELAGAWTSVGVIAVPEQHELHELHELLAARAPAVTLLVPDEAKGLEFDAVVVVEPAAIVESTGDPARGSRLLYVALTRAVQELVVVHSRPLPKPLANVGSFLGS
ncbi:MAG: HelD family protein [Acidimicrobiales bacterium]